MLPNSCTKLVEPTNNGQTVLPEKLMVNPDIYVDEMDLTTGITYLGASLTVNTVEVHSGKASLKLTSAPGATARISKTVNWRLSEDQSKSIKVWIYPHSEVSTTISSFTFYALKDANETDYFACSIPTTNIKHNEWNLLKWTPPNSTSWETVGSPSWSDISIVRLKVAAKSGQVTQCSFDLLTAGITFKPAVIIKFDDCNISDYTYAYPLLKGKNMIATSYIISDQIDHNARLTTANIMELNNNGWAIANHTKSHPNMILLTEQEVYNEFNNCQIFLDGLGLSKSSKDITVPGGAASSTILAAVESWGLRTKVLGDTGYTNGYEVSFPYNINAFGIQNDETVDQVKTYIDLAISKGEVAVLQLHQLVEHNADDRTKWLVSQFSEILDYVESLNLQTLTIDEYFRLYSGPITVNHK